MKRVEINLQVPKTPVLERIVGLFQRQVKDRSGLEVEIYSPGKGLLNDETVKVILATDSGIGKEGFRIGNGAKNEIIITGADERGILYGVGKFLRTSRFLDGSFEPGTWRGVSVPEKEIRGIYFATHFFNYYHVAPVAEIEKYVEDLSLWGYNSLMVWFDMHHFTGRDDPAAVEMLERLKAILKAAQTIGMSIGVAMLANEAYGNSPEELRADWTGGHDGYRSDLYHYHAELCPNKPGAMDLMLKWRKEVLTVFSGTGLDFIVIWPYDQGGCTCSQCKPWGANGYLKMARPIAELFRSLFPGSKVILSTWCFDLFTTGEWEGLAKVFKKTPAWVDFIMADYGYNYVNNLPRFPEYPLKNGVPGNLPLLNFSEISMWGAYPWGGYGANPLPAYLRRLWNPAGKKISGGFPYSEGIYEDINKAICSQHYWKADKTVEETIREYVTFEYSPEAVNNVTKAIEILEETYPRKGLTEEEISRREVRIRIVKSERVNEAYGLLEQAQTKLSSYSRNSWRWQILFLRSLIDYELKKNNFQVSREVKKALEKLTAIYQNEKLGPAELLKMFVNHPR